jgi:hypothetical protein
MINWLKNNIFSNNKKVLGRWTLDNCDKKINRKIDFSNEDHCGPCGITTVRPQAQLLLPPTPPPQTKSKT